LNSKLLRGCELWCGVMSGVRDCNLRIGGGGIASCELVGELRVMGGYDE